MGQTNGVTHARAIVLVCAISTLWSGGAFADPRVHVDAAKNVLVHAGGTIPIPLQAIAMDQVTSEDIALEGGASVTHVRVAAEPYAWEALVAGDKVIFSGLTGFTRGQDGERAGEIVQVLGRDGAKESDVLVGDVREDRTICGQEATALRPRVLDARTMELRGATVQRLPLAQREKASRIVAAARGGPAEPALARLVNATGASSGNPKLLTDGDPATVWTEARPGRGQGEFVTMEAPADVAITRVAVTIAPPRSAVRDAEGAAPQAFFLVTKDRTFAVTMPEDAWMHPGDAYEVPLPEPVMTRCLSVVLDAAYTRTKTPKVSIAELVAYTAFDGADGSLEKVARALTGGGLRADGAAAILKRADGSLAAVRAVYKDLDAPGRALAMDVASAAPCDVSAPLLTDALGDDDREVVRKAKGKLERCGKTAAPALADAVRRGTPQVRMHAATMLARVAPREALAPLADVLGDGDAKTRSAVRGALGHAARGADNGALEALLARDGTAAKTVEMLRALSERLGDVRDRADVRLADLLVPGAAMETRYLLATPMSDLARAGDDADAARLGALVAGDPDAAVRAHAAELAAGIPAVEARVVAAAQDPAPRVREAALRSIARAHARAGETAASDRLARDGWTFVRAAAATALAGLPASPGSDRALVNALRDPSPRVRATVVDALAVRGSRDAAAGIAARALDEKEDTEVRLAALRATGRMCTASAADGLTRLLASGASQVADEDARSLAIAAIDALGRLHPNDLPSRLAVARAGDANDAVKRAAAHALAATETCK